MNAPPQDQLAENIAPLMFWLSLACLALTASILVLWIDVPRVTDTVALLDELESTLTSDTPSSAKLPIDEFALKSIIWGERTFYLVLWIWPIFVAEQLLHFVRSKRGESFWRQHRYWWAFCLCPPLRMCARHRGSSDRIWLPTLGWQIADHNLVRRLERAFSMPMIEIALLILPVLGLQMFYQDRIVDYPRLRFVLHVGTGIIWFAFATEFIVMVSVTPRKVKYCLRHWLDLVIIVLPLISFLRTLRILRAAKLLNITKLQQLTRLIRVYRLRGVALRGWRALVLLELTQRILFQSPAKRLRKLEELYGEKELELQELKQQIEKLRARASPATEAVLDRQSIGVRDVS